MHFVNKALNMKAKLVLLLDFALLMKPHNLEEVVAERREC